MSMFNHNSFDDFYLKQLEQKRRYLEAMERMQAQVAAQMNIYPGVITWSSTIGTTEIIFDNDNTPASDTKIPEGILPGDGKMIGYLEAYRAWKFHISLARLKSDFMDQIVWEPKKPLKAVNNGNHISTHGGGIYASKTLAAIESSYKDGGQSLSGLTYHVLGKVALWGAIKEHKDGYRAEYAYPTQFIRVTNVAPEFEFVLIKALSEIYLPRR